MGLVVGIEPANIKVSDWPRVHVEDVGQCIHALPLPAAEFVIDDEVQVGGVPKGATAARGKWSARHI